MANYKILVVDDEEDLCEILKFNLEVEGYDVDTANSAEEALQMNLTDYNLLLLDVMMGEISGYRLARILRERIQNGLSVKKKREAETYSHHFFNGQRYRRRQTHGI